MADKSTDRAGWGITEWGARYGFSKATSYRVIKAGNGPRTSFVPGTTKQIITREADEEWRARLNGIDAKAA